MNQLTIGKRYIFVNTFDATYTGDVVEITTTAVKINHKSTAFQQKEGMHHIPQHFISKTFCIDDLIVGKPYRFTTTNKTFEGIFMSVTGTYESIQLIHCDIEYPRAVVSFPIYWIKDIRIVE